MNNVKEYEQQHQDKQKLQSYTSKKKREKPKWRASLSVRRTHQFSTNHMLNITSSALKIAVHYLFMCACLNLQLVAVNLFMTACHTICVHIYSHVWLYSFIFYFLSTYLQHLYIYWHAVCACVCVKQYIYLWASMNSSLSLHERMRFTTTVHTFIRSSPLAISSRYRE